MHEQFLLNRNYENIVIKTQATNDIKKIIHTVKEFKCGFLKLMKSLKIDKNRKNIEPQFFSKSSRSLKTKNLILW